MTTQKKFLAAAAGVILAFWVVTAVFADLDEAVEITGNPQERSSAHLEPARMRGQIGIAVVFEGTEDLHYYARKATAAGGFNLEISAESGQISFAKTIFPEYKLFDDKTQGKQVEVFVGDFTVFVPIDRYTQDTADFSITIKGIACTSVMCLPPFEKVLSGSLDLSTADSWPEIDFPVASKEETIQTGKVISGKSYSVAVALVLAVLAGLLFNVMPCVLPVIPLIISRLISQAKESGLRRVGLGLAFCAGIISFFVAFAVVSLIFRFAFGTIFNWGDHLRVPQVVMGMGIFLLVLALFMFDVFRIGIPSSVTSKSSGGGALGSIGMGFLAALLSTPCSGAILAGVLAWAQTQTWALSTIAILLMGVGMALPYAIVISIPSLVEKLPKPGTWMEMLRKAMGFVLLFIAVNLLVSLSKERLISVLYFGVIVSFAVWMWGGWVGFSTASIKKWAVRLTAVIIAVAAGFYFLPEKQDLINWWHYDAEVIAQAKSAGKPVLIKFTAGWCTSCKWLEKTVYNTKEIAELVKVRGVVAVKADTTDRDSEATKAHSEVYGEAGVPVTIVFLPDGEEVRFRGVFGKDEMKELLKRLPERKD
jgi:thiol:disulfide interchange protein DsbD